MRYRYRGLIEGIFEAEESEYHQMIVGSRKDPTSRDLAR